MLEFVCFREEMSREFYYYDGVLLINAALSTARKTKIIEEYLQLKS